MNEVDLLASAPIELRVWRQFLAVAETLHFGRAARRLGMTQPPLTQAIQKLEQELGTVLFERTRRRVALAPSGAALIEPVGQLLRDAAAVAQVARDAASGQLGTIRLGFVSTVGFGPLPAWVRGFREAYPSVTIRLREATSDVQLAALGEGELDAGFVLHAPGRSLESRVPLRSMRVGIEPMLLAVPDTSPASTRRIPFLHWMPHPLIIFPRASAPSLYDAVLAFYHHLGLTPAIAQEAIQMQTIVNLVSAGLGVAWVPEVVSFFRRQGVAYRVLPRDLARSAPRVETSLVWPEDAPPVVENFVEHVRRT